RRAARPRALGRGGRAVAFEPLARPETYTIKDWIKAFAIDPEPARHAGKPVRVRGCAPPDDPLPRAWFLAARFVVRCCAVDAQPVGLPVRAPAPPAGGRWITVEGTWDVADVAGARRAAVSANFLF